VIEHVVERVGEPNGAGRGSGGVGRNGATWQTALCENTILAMQAICCFEQCDCTQCRDRVVAAGLHFCSRHTRLSRDRFKPRLVNR
jgi:hypothetical protein